jgi:hypothetical protein
MKYNYGYGEDIISRTVKNAEKSSRKTFGFFGTCSVLQRTHKQQKTNQQ